MEPPLGKTLPAEAAPQPLRWMGTHCPRGPHSLSRATAPPPHPTPGSGSQLAQWKSAPRPCRESGLRASCWPGLPTRDSARFHVSEGNPASVASPARAHVHAQTHPHVLRIVGQAPQPFDDSVPVLLPLPLAEHNLQEVPRPADEGHEQQLPFGQDFGALEGGGKLVVRCRTRGPPGHPRTGLVGGDFSDHRGTRTLRWHCLTQECRCTFLQMRVRSTSLAEGG